VCRHRVGMETIPHLTHWIWGKCHCVYGFPVLWMLNMRLVLRLMLALAKGLRSM
jgi:hypothetical protein